MGSTTYSSSDWKSYSTTASTKTVDQIYTKSTMDPKNNPVNITVRESRDSDAHPETIPVFINVDGSGSMGPLSLQIARKVGTLFEELIKLHKEGKIPYPQVAVGIFRDVRADASTFYQVTQFESDTATLMAQVENFALVGTGGGGNRSESEGLAWFMGTSKVVHDHFLKRGRKGIFVTIGDEEVPPDLSSSDIKTVFDDTAATSLSNKELIDALSKQWHVFHLMVEEGSHMKWYPDDVKRSWSKLLGEHAVLLSRTEAMVETVTALVMLMEGVDPSVVASTWKGDTAVAVVNATKGIKVVDTATSGAVVSF